MSDGGPSAHAAQAADYWRGLCPGLHVTDGATVGFEARAPDPGALAAARAALRREGFARLPALLAADSLRPLAEGIARVQAAGWPTAFAFVYDEPWQVYQALDGWLAGVLEPGYLRMPDFWAFHVSPAPGHVGFPAHRERQYRRPLLPDGRVVAVSAWFALSEATLANGCLHVLPMDRDPEPLTFDPFSKALREWFGTARPWRPPRSLAEGVPLTAAAGDLILLNPWILHWSGEPQPAAHAPRVSLALEFQRGDEPPLNQPLSAPASLPAFAERVRVCAQQVIQYKALFRADPRALALADALAGAEGRRGVASR